MEDEITDLIQHIQRVHCLENKGCICYAATENRVSILTQKRSPLLLVITSAIEVLFSFS